MWDSWREEGNRVVNLLPFRACRLRCRSLPLRSAPMNPRYKPLLLAAFAVVGVWLLAWAGMRLAASSRMTPEKLIALLHETDLARLDAAARAKKLQQLADKLNTMPRDDRRSTRADQEWDRVWKQMTEAEKGELVERTMPSGVKQMLTAFEQLPEDKRRSAITNAIARMRADRESDESPVGARTDREPMSEEMQQKVVTTGLKTFYSESSAQTKAEVAPLLEEMQQAMQSGKMFRR